MEIWALSYFNKWEGKAFSYIAMISFVQVTEQRVTVSS